MSDDANKSVMDKIRKCLALSESSNEHEAAAAMRQARALMAKHGLSADDMDIFKIKEETLTVKYSSPPRWFMMLGTVVAQAFSCTLFYRYQRFTFVGQNAAAEVAGYSFDVLHRQLARSKKEFIEQKSIRFAAAATKRKMGQAFCEGWIIGVGSVVEEFAARLTDQQQQAHVSFMEALTKRDVVDGKVKKSAISNDEASRWAANQGIELGEQVQLREGVAAGEQPLRLNQSSGAM